MSSVVLRLPDVKGEAESHSEGISIPMLLLLTHLSALSRVGRSGAGEPALGQVGRSSTLTL